MPTPVVSICIITYQQARFIAQAIEGALMQKSGFETEIVIGEDGSTDGTREICLRYEKQLPDRVRIFVRDRSDKDVSEGQLRAGRNLVMTLREARGEFIALCEGDDYWTDPEKLQRQVDYLQANPDCVGCFHDTKLVDADGRILAESYFQSTQDKFTQEDVLATLLSREPTCSLMFRKSALTEPLPEWFLRRPSDLYLDIFLSQRGSLGFIRQNMGAYRKHSAGIWSGDRESRQIVELIVRFKLLLADPSFVSNHRNILLSKIEEFQQTLLTASDTQGEIKRLQSIVQTQTDYITLLEKERERLAALVSI